jgi:hypothetical protein
LGTDQDEIAIKGTDKMKSYKLYTKGNETIAIKQGWSWPAFCFAWIWAFTKKLILSAVIALVANLVFAFIPVPNSMTPYWVIAGVIFGVKGNKWWETKLAKDGYSYLRTVQAKGPAEAVASKT